MLSFDRHAEHSAYLIRNGHLRGLSAQEVQVVALVARYHAEGRPGKGDAHFKALPKAWRRAVQWLAAMLRIAEALDRSHYQLIRGLRVARRGGRYAILLRARRDAQLELWAARRRTGLLAGLLGRRGSRAEVSVRLDAASVARLRGANGAASRSRRRAATRKRSRRGADGVANRSRRRSVRGQDRSRRAGKPRRVRRSGARQGAAAARG